MRKRKGEEGEGEKGEEVIEEEIASFEASRRSPFSCKLPSQGFLEATPHVFILISGGGRSGQKARHLLS